MNVQSNPALTNVNGLAALTSVAGYLQFYNNGVLQSLGLSALQTVGGYFDIQSDNALANVNGLAALTSVGGYLQIYSNSGITTLDGLKNLASVGTTINDYIYIYNNGALTSITGLIKPTGKLANLSGYLTVQSNGALVTCQPDALKAALAAGGWAKTYTQNGNLACTKTCVGAVCQ